MAEDSYLFIALNAAICMSMFSYIVNQKDLFYPQNGAVSVSKIQYYFWGEFSPFGMELFWPQ